MVLDQAQLLKNYLESRKTEENNLDAIDNNDGPKSKIITVTSGKGGVGKTNFTVNFSLELAKLGKKVLIIDADFGLSNIDVILGINPRYSLVDIIKKEKHIEEVICDAPHGLKFISGGSGVFELISLDRDTLSYFIDELSSLDGLADIIIFDTGAGINKKNIQLMQASDEVILVATTEPPAIIDAYALLKTIHRVDDEMKVKLVVNKCASKKEADNIINNFVTVAEKYLEIDIDSLGFVMEDQAVIKSVKMQKPFVLSCPNSEAAKNIYEIARAFLDLSKETTHYGIKSFFRKFLK